MEPSSVAKKSKKRRDIVEVVDIIFLDIDGVLLPFGNDSDTTVETYSDECIFPDRTMDALTSLLEGVANLEFLKKNDRTTTHETTASTGHCSPTPIRGNPKLVLSSTWRARPAFIQDILSSFRSYVNAKKDISTGTREIWQAHLESFFDITDPSYHSTRHEEIYNWIKSNTYYSTTPCQKLPCNKQGRLPASTQQDMQCIVRSWIALDDEELVDVQHGYAGTAKHAVKTVSSIGLTRKDVDLALELVKNQMMEFHL
ncbi:hypothetical protein HJC23_002215 [Cyclotella cryptica]|uniref:Uncharacterized protein n=1 Tax=Cyclotella cryptica TaxID=29204 RepID=A0ABD3P3Y7_9STRA|eukprot:CCRYP_017862-RA/>CCRYP_017862-RA protein AED:0.20 eAED:0.20 QI:0/-1/0/1/-1/1/1/0/255